MSAVKLFELFDPQTGLQIAPVPVFGDQSSAAQERWNHFLDQSSYVPFQYSFEHAKYQFAYSADRCDEWLDLSCVIYQGGVDIGIWPLLAIRKNTTWKIESQTSEVLTPLFRRGLSEKQKKKCVLSCFQWLGQICSTLGISSYTASVLLNSVESVSWQRKVFDLGSKQRLRHQLYVDLDQDLATLRSGFRRRYKSLINEGLRLWSATLVTGDSESVFPEFQAFHKRISGRVTRSDLTWQLQQRAVEAREAFLVLLRNPQSNALVGAGLFHYTRDEAIYAVGVYDRELFDMPIGHVVQFKAIEYMKSLGLKTYFVGRRPYLMDDPTPTQKELQIGEFKEGFANRFSASVEVEVLTPEMSKQIDR